MQIKTYLQILVTTLSLLLSSMSHAAKDQITVLLDWFINPDHAPLIVAEQTGLFDKASLNVTLVEPADPSLPPKLAAAKKADVAISYQPSLMVDLNNQLPLMRIGTIVNSPLNSLVVLADSQGFKAFLTSRIKLLDSQSEASRTQSSELCWSLRA